MKFPANRWTALVLSTFAMFLCYIFMDILSPLKSLLETSRGWDSVAFGTYSGSSSFFNVFFFFLIFAGIILDKKGMRFTAFLSVVVMSVGAVINWYSITKMFAGTNLERWFNNNLNYIPVFSELDVSPFYLGMPASAKLASVGFMIFGCGIEMAGITVMSGIFKRFKGKELASAMGINTAIVRLSVATCMILSPLIANTDILGSADVSHPAAFGFFLVLFALIVFSIYFHIDNKLQFQRCETEEKDEAFKVRDVGKILKNTGFWLIALLCVLYYSAIIPFQKYAVNMLECNLTFAKLPDNSFWASGAVAIAQYLIMMMAAAAAFSSNFCKKSVKTTLTVCSASLLAVICFITYKQQSAGAVFSVLPLLAIGITPILGNFIDRKGKAATMLMLGSILLIACHISFAFILPLFKGNTTGGFILAYITILTLGASFSLVPASLWPSIPKLVDKNVIGTAYALIFWIQNIGLWLFPILIGKILTSSNKDIAEKLSSGLITSDEASIMYDYTNPLIMLACLGVAALVAGFILKTIDRKKGIGLELPNTT